MLSLTLRARRYTVLDGIGVSFRSAPAAALLYGALALASAAVVPLATLAAGRFIDAAVASYHAGTPTSDLYRALAILAGLTAFQWLKVALTRIVDLRLTLALRARYRTALTEKRTRLAYRLIEDSATWDLIERVAANPEGGRLKATYYHQVDIVAFAIKVGGLLAILASAVWWGPVPVALVSAGAVAVGIRGGKRIYAAEQQVSRSDRQTECLREVLLGRDTAAERTIFGFTPMVMAMWRRAFAHALGVRIRARVRWYINAYAGDATNLALWVFLMLVLIAPLRAGAVSVGLFIALTQAFTRFDIVWGFMDTVNGLSADAEFFKELTQFLSLPEHSSGPRAAHGQAPRATARTAPGFAALSMRGVRFRYPGTERWVLDGLCADFEAGTHYALVGANGSGKTTVTRLLTRLFQPDAGSISIDGTDVGAMDYDELLAYYAIVYQDFARYGVTVRDNIVLGATSNGATGATDAAGATDDPTLARIIDDVGLSTLVDRLPDGLDTRLGKSVPGGVDVSGGEWQRIAMARCLARPAAVRILDEPTASLDPVAECALYDRFNRLTEGATSILITHRLGATRIADVILVLDEGRIVETGSHASLMRTDGLYRRMYESQRYWYET